MPSTCCKVRESHDQTKMKTGVRSKEIALSIPPIQKPWSPSILLHLRVASQNTREVLRRQTNEIACIGVMFAKAVDN